MQQFPQAPSEDRRESWLAAVLLGHDNWVIFGFSFYLSSILNVSRLSQVKAVLISFHYHKVFISSVAVSLLVKVNDTSYLLVLSFHHAKQTSCYCCMLEPLTCANTHKRLWLSSQSAFHGPLHLFGKLLYRHMMTVSVATNRERITREQFVKAGREILMMYEEKQLVRFYFHFFAEGKEFLTIEGEKIAIVSSVCSFVLFVTYT